MLIEFRQLECTVWVKAFEDEIEEILELRDVTADAWAG